MRSVSAPLLAAQRVSPQRPRVRVLVRDKQARVMGICSGTTPDVSSCACMTQDGAKIVMVALDTAGSLWVRDVPTPSAGLGIGGWGVWTSGWTEVVAAGGALAWSNGDVAISENAGTLRIFYVKADGMAILTISRLDGGSSWSAPATVGAVAGGGAGEMYVLAAGGNDDVWYAVANGASSQFKFSRYSGGAWAAWTVVADIVEGGGPFGSCYGLAVQWSAADQQYAIVASLDYAVSGGGRLVACWYDPAVGVHGWRAIVPPGYPMAGFVPWQPAFIRTPSDQGPVWVLTYWDTFTSGATSWAEPMCILSRDWEHWSYKIPLGVQVVAHYNRICPVMFHANDIYLAVVECVSRMYLWYSGEERSELTVAQEKVLRYRILERPESGRLTVEMDNRGGTYDNPGDWGSPAQAMMPLAQIIVDQGLTVAGSAVRVESRPFYLWSHSTVRESGVNLVRLYAVDGWELLRMWRPDCVIEWEGQTLGWCIAELAARVGNWEVVTDGSALWDEVLTYLTVAVSYDDSVERWYIRSVGRWLDPDESVVMFGSNMSGLTILHHLLGLVGSVARFGNGNDREVLHVLIPQLQGSVPWPAHTYNDGELLALDAVKGFVWPTRVLVSGSAGGYQAVDGSAAAVLGMDILQMEYVSHWATSALLADVAAAVLDDAAARGFGGWIRTRPNVGLELFDVILFTDSKAGGGLPAMRRRVNGLVTEFDPLRRVWSQTVYVEGV